MFRITGTVTSATCANCGEQIELCFNKYHPDCLDYAVWFHITGPTSRHLCGKTKMYGKQRRILRARPGKSPQNPGRVLLRSARGGRDG